MTTQGGHYGSEKSHYFVTDASAGIGKLLRCACHHFDSHDNDNGDSHNNANANIDSHDNDNPYANPYPYFYANTGK